MDNRTVLYEVKDRVGYITLNRPDHHNSINKDILDQFSTILSACKHDDNCRILIITGAGEKAFCAGADINMFTEVIHDALGGRDWSRYGQTIFSMLDNLGKPSIAAINGMALGGGFELALACTFRIASQKARFGFSEISLGFIPGWGGIVRMTRILGKTKTAELVLTGRHIDAGEALDLGVVNSVVSPEELLPASEALALKIMNNSPVAVRLALEALHYAEDLSFDEALMVESNIAGLACNSEDAKEGIKAFIEKRYPQFKGK
ncbi:MAG: putative enoyl-CoA hydratase echA8 [Syntrophorhabdus sp. PtaU1.Bin058]|nr:MAG: putative enoyl-CoA hydratase echA8 [Syntrophorhabdus sp. PtaU1.Bin058]